MDEFLKEIDLENISDEQRKSIQEHYNSVFGPLTDQLTEMVSLLIKANDSLGLLYLSETCSVILRSGFNFIKDSETDEPEPDNEQEPTEDFVWNVPGQCGKV